jgi:TPR repeat protein
MRWWMMMVLAASLLALGCSNEVALRPAKTCQGGNVDECKASCGQSDGEACYRLGWLYEDGLGVPQNENKATKLYVQACDANWAVACRALGIMYWQGERVKRSRKKAIEYYKKACGLGLAEACPTEKMIAQAEGRKPKRGAGVSGGFSVDAGGTAEEHAPDAPEAPTPEAPEAPTPSLPGG